MPTLRLACALSILVCIVTPAAADSRSSADGERHMLYAEAFGKGGLYGLGYDYRWRPRLGFGVALSAYSIDSERVLSLSPYVSTEIVSRGRHVWFAHAGARLVDRRLESPVEGWDGTGESGIAAQLASGYEYRGPVVVRASAVFGYGEGGLSPWAGLAIGRRF